MRFSVSKVKNCNSLFIPWYIFKKEFLQINTINTIALPPSFVSSSSIFRESENLERKKPSTLEKRSKLNWNKTNRGSYRGEKLDHRAGAKRRGEIKFRSSDKWAKRYRRRERERERGVMSVWRIGKDIVSTVDNQFHGFKASNLRGGRALKCGESRIFKSRPPYAWASLDSCRTMGWTVSRIACLPRLAAWKCIHRPSALVMRL